MMETLFQDLKYGFRVLLKSRGFTLIAVSTLALGIGANTALFSVVNGVLLNPLPYPDPGQLLAVTEKFPPFPEASIAYPNFLDWVRMNHTFQGLAAYRHTNFNLTDAGEAQRLNAVEISASFFPLLGVDPVIGRNFSADDDQRGVARVAMLSSRLWKNKFGGSPAILGRVLNLDGIGYMVVGIVPQDFYFCCKSMNFELGDVYVPIGSEDAAWITDRDSHPGIRAIGRMKAGVTVEQARANLEEIASNLARAYPESNKNSTVVLTPLRQRMVQGIEFTLLVLLAAVAFVLLIACANVANLILARSAGRAREFAVRSVLGATQTRVVRQLLTESLLLAIAGGALGLLLASFGTTAALAVLPQALPRANDVRIDLRVLLFTLSISIVTGVLFGLAPSLRTSRSDPHDTLKEGGRGGSGARHRKQKVFVVFELALAIVLLVGAGLTLRSLVRLWNMNRGFNPQNVSRFDLAFSPSVKKETPDQVRSMLRQLPESVAQIPGVMAASLTDASMPLRDDWEQTFWLEGSPKPATIREMPETLFYIVSRDYLRVMRIPLLRGRFFTPQDSGYSRRVCVIDEDFAREYFPNQDPIGRGIRFFKDSTVEIVGVVGHTQQWGQDDVSNGSVKVQLYTLAEQAPNDWLEFVTTGAGIVLRTQTPNYPSPDAIRLAMKQISSEQVSYNFDSMDQIISRSLESRRFGMILLALFAAVALLLASIGIYGVMSYVASQRTHEIGVRIALGAQRHEVLKLVFGEAARMTFTGVLVGLVTATELARLIRTLLFDVSPTDPLTFGGVALLLTGVAFAACYIPARRAMRVDPIVALRYE